ncbi:hypothetical protein QN277_019424 [Acacia crassicarpa]|uniref:Uncharacterized protein n=1 Tax=Acacia crassicarpa TaxID=499986 RepID=A0AAE1JM94_9FABA|nr:hypothetical protein QN277_019424 [Acacia crassicarpa]
MVVTTVSSSHSLAVILKSQIFRAAQRFPSSSESRLVLSSLQKKKATELQRFLLSSVARKRRSLLSTLQVAGLVSPSTEEQSSPLIHRLVLFWAKIVVSAPYPAPFAAPTIAISSHLFSCPTVEVSSPCFIQRY